MLLVGRSGAIRLRLSAEARNVHAPPTWRRACVPAGTLRDNPGVGTAGVLANSWAVSQQTL